MRFPKAWTHYNITDSAQSSPRHRKQVPERISGQTACQCCMALLGKVKGRSIPACAGEVLLRAGSRVTVGVYPRVCGGSVAQQQRLGLLIGLSPRVRGKHLQNSRSTGHRGAIPACAEEAQRKHRPAVLPAVYPRVCGGSASGLWVSGLGAGLSPRVRGKRGGAHPVSRNRGSIPACAGEALSPATRPCLAGVYPRVCGGSLVVQRTRAGYAGLSPRVRGKPTRGDRPCGGHRSIPACAGEALLGGMAHDAQRVYPRVCGGSPLPGARNSRRAGLSPRVRGKPGSSTRKCRRRRSIPACAGEATPTARCRPPATVYPRVCGGSPLRVGVALLVSGLSPRVRGKPAGRRRPPAIPGSIPACAGEALSERPPTPSPAVYPRVCGGSAKATIG